MDGTTGGHTGPPLRLYPTDLAPDCTLLLEPNDGEDQKLFTALSFEVNDIEAEHKRLTAQGVEFTQPPTKMEWGGTLAYFHDPEGHVLGMVSTGDA